MSSSCQEAEKKRHRWLFNLQAGRVLFLSKRNSLESIDETCGHVSMAIPNNAKGSANDSHKRIRHVS